MKSILLTILIVAFAGAIAILLKPFFYSGITIHLAGDSTMSVQLASKRPGTGWGEFFASLLCEDVRVINHAKNGRSTKSFKSEGHWKRLLERLRSGDVVMIQFGHNDQKISDPKLYSSAWQGYQENLRHFVSDVRERNAVPVLLTSLVRRDFDAQGKLQPTLGEYPAATRKVATEMTVQLIDLNVATRELLESMGSAESSTLYLHLDRGVSRNYPEGIQDNTHLNAQGALKVAVLIADELRRAQPDLVCP